MENADVIYFATVPAGVHQTSQRYPSVDTLCTMERYSLALSMAGERTLASAKQFFYYTPQELTATSDMYRASEHTSEVATQAGRAAAL
jgi:hypothetical protein